MRAWGIFIPFGVTLECVVQNPPHAVASPLTVATALRRAYAHWRAGQAAQAEQLCKQVMAVRPDHPDALHLLGIMAHAYGKADRALACLRAATRSPQAPALFYSNLAEMCRQQGLLDEAERAATRAVQQDPQLIDAWHNLGIIAQERGDLAFSLRCLRKVLAARPDSPQAHNNLANTLRRLNETDRALQHYQQALDLDEDYVQAHSNQAALLCHLGRLAEAAAAAERAIERDPRFVDAYLNRAEIALRGGCAQDTQRWLDALQAFAPDTVGGLLLYARLRWAQARRDDALTLLRQALAQAPDNAQARDLLARWGEKNAEVPGGDVASAHHTPHRPDGPPV